MISPYIAEFVGTTILLLLGSGIVANVSLSKTKGSKETPLITITTAWGFAVFVAAYITGDCERCSGDESHGSILRRWSLRSAAVPAGTNLQV